MSNNLNIQTVQSAEKRVRRLGLAGRAGSITQVFEEIAVISVLDGNVVIAEVERPTGRLQVIDVKTGAERWYKADQQLVVDHPESGCGTALSDSLASTEDFRSPTTQKAER